MSSTRTIGSLLLVACVAGCATNIKPQDETIVPSKVPLGSFQNVALLPIATNRSDGDEGDRAAIRRIGDEFTTCIRGVFPGIRQAQPGEGYAPSTLLIEPRIEDITKKTSAERVMLGPLAGSSAVLFKVTYTRADDRAVVAAPVFYAKANAWGGAYSFGTTDNRIMSRVVNNACAYARTNR